MDSKTSLVAQQFWRFNGQFAKRFVSDRPSGNKDQGDFAFLRCLFQMLSPKYVLHCIPKCYIIISNSVYKLGWLPSCVTSPSWRRSRMWPLYVCLKCNCSATNSNWIALNSFASLKGAAGWFRMELTNHWGCEVGDFSESPLISATFSSFVHHTNGYI